MVEWLVLRQDVPVDIPDWSEMRPLHYAAMKALSPSAACVQQPAQLRALTQLVSTMRESHMHVQGRTKTCKLLLRMKADPAVSKRSHPESCRLDW